MKIRSVFFTALTVSVVACSSSQNLIAERQRSAPPHSAGDVGVVLESASTAQVNSILQNHPGAQVRVLNTQHGMYEIFGVAPEQVQSEFAGFSEANRFIPSARPKRMQDFSVPLPAGFQAGSLAPCKAAATGGPTAVLSVDSPMSQLDGATIEIGKTVTVNAKQSAAGAGSSVPLKTVIAVQFPDAALNQQQVVDGNTFQFTPDTLGLHQVFVVVQDGNSACAIDGIQFIVTANRPYNGPNAADLAVDLTKFQHLAQISAQAAWNVSQGDGMVIAIIDTGIDYNHPLLAPQVYVNKGEIPSNGIDDDKNGFIDDYLGYDFANQDPYPYDDDSHGTHVAGLAAGKHFGLAQNAKILAVKTMTPAGGDIGTIAAGIRYAVDRGANILNLSLGGEGTTPPAVLVSALAYAQQKGVLVVVAAGNGDAQTGIGFDIDTRPVYPPSLSPQYDNILAVAASDSTDALTPYSNYGANSVGVVAPGGFTNDLLLSCAFENPRGAMFIQMAGTSMATPIVAGIAAQVWSHSRGMSYHDVKNALMSAGKQDPLLQGKVISGRHIDSLGAVTQSATPTPAASTVLF